MNKLSAMLLSATAVLSMQTKIIAHRGFWQKGNSAQNSISSLKNAQDLEVYGSEFDVRMTKDGKLIVNHDAELNNLEISESNWSALKKQKLHNGEEIPTFEKYLKQGKENSSVKLIVELKPAKNLALEIEMVKKALKEVCHLGLLEQCEFISFSLNICKEIKKLNPEGTVQYLNGDLSPQELAKLGFDGFDYHYKVLQQNPTWIQEAQNLGLMTNAWTVNDENVFRELKNSGIGHITTDIPHLLKNN
ncbi:glycerophosphodiester phosphodiesterase [Flavobacteriaceae bacterium JJC]|nr:glycerophosphodiester phosphodiesterase [Flavobacteriaceae bacterium JJC]